MRPKQNPTCLEATTMTLPVAHIPMTCTIGSHQWTTKRNDSGDTYELCLGCGKQSSWVPLWAAS
jgi:hypothetical protein